MLPTGVSGVKGLGVIFKWMSNKVFGFKEPMDNRVAPREWNTQTDDAPYYYTAGSYSWAGPPSSSGFGGDGGSSWGEPPSKGK
jgi:hypothetical protein